MNEDVDGKVEKNWRCGVALDDSAPEFESIFPGTGDGGEGSDVSEEGFDEVEVGIGDVNVLEEGE